MKNNPYKKDDKVIMNDGIIHVVKSVDINKVFIDINEHTKKSKPLISGYPVEWFALYDFESLTKIENINNISTISILDESKNLVNLKFKTNNGTKGTVSVIFKNDNSLDVQIIAHNKKDLFFEKFVKSIYSLNFNEFKKVILDLKNDNKISSLLNNEEIIYKPNNSFNQ